MITIDFRGDTQGSEISNQISFFGHIFLQIFSAKNIQIHNWIHENKITRYQWVLSISRTNDWFRKNYYLLDKEKLERILHQAEPPKVLPS